MVHNGPFFCSRHEACSFLLLCFVQTTLLYIWESNQESKLWHITGVIMKSLFKFQLFDKKPSVPVESWTVHQMVKNWVNWWQWILLLHCSLMLWDVVAKLVRPLPFPMISPHVFIELERWSLKMILAPQDPFSSCLFHLLHPRNSLADGTKFELVSMVMMGATLRKGRKEKSRWGVCAVSRAGNTSGKLDLQRMLSVTHL